MIGNGCTADNQAACWQAAINASQRWPSFGRVVGTAGKTYKISNTIVICNAAEGVIDGRGAQLEWQGKPTDEQGRPKSLFLVLSSNHIRFTNFYIKSSAPSYPLGAAFEFASTVTNPKEYSEAICPGAPRPSSKNSIDHVTVEGTNLNGLLYGVRFSNRYGININGASNDGINNDMSTVIDSNFYNVTNAAISVEHSQSGQHRLIAVNGYGAPGNKGCYVDAQSGMLASTGGFQGSWGKANFCLSGTSGTFDITESDSEGSKRLLSSGNVGDATGFPVSINIQGGRFAVNGLHADGKLIDFNRLGPLLVRGLHIDGSPPVAGTQASISIQPGQMPHVPPIAGSAIIEGVSFMTPSSNSWPITVVKSFIDLTYQSNLCVDKDSYSVACMAPQRN